METTKLHALIFVSSATEINNAEETRIILEAERQSASKQGLTGIILFASGSLLRMIEGDRDSVISSFELIKRNLLHHNVIQILDKPIDQRYFEGFPAAYLPIGYEAHRAINDFKAPEMKELLDECLALDSPFMKILKDFIKNNS